MTLNTPTWTQYTGTGYDGTGTSYNNWTWRTDSTDSNRRKYYRDTRFETTLGGTKQAFALSFGDIYGAIGIPNTTPGNVSVPLLTFSANGNSFALRSPGSRFNSWSYISNDALYYPEDNVSNARPIRPAMYLSVD